MNNYNSTTMKKLYKLILFLITLQSSVFNGFAQTANPDDQYWDDQFRLDGINGNIKQAVAKDSYRRVITYTSYWGIDSSFLEIIYPSNNSTLQLKYRLYKKTNNESEIISSGFYSLKNDTSIFEDRNDYKCYGIGKYKLISQNNYIKFNLLSESCPQREGFLDNKNFLLKSDVVRHFDEIYMTGSYFSNLNGKSINNLAIWDGITWEQLGDGKLPVNSLQIIEDTVYNDFGMKWNNNQWIELSNDKTFGNVRYDMSGPNLIKSKNKIFITGFFTSTKTGLDTLSSSRIPYKESLACWNGFEWVEFPEVHISQIKKIVYVSNGEFYFLSQYWNNNSFTYSIFYWDNVKLTEIIKMLSPNEAINDITLLNGNLIIGGYFSKINNINAENLAKWSPTNNTINGFLNNLGPVNSLAVLEQKIIIQVNNSKLYFYDGQTFKECGKSYSNFGCQNSKSIFFYSAYNNSISSITAGNNSLSNIILAKFTIINDKSIIEELIDDSESNSVRNSGKLFLYKNQILVSTSWLQVGQKDFYKSTKWTGTNWEIFDGRPLAVINDSLFFEKQGKIYCEFNGTTKNYGDVYTDNYLNYGIGSGPLNISGIAWFKNELYITLNLARIYNNLGYRDTTITLEKWNGKNWNPVKEYKSKMSEFIICDKNNLYVESTNMDNPTIYGTPKCTVSVFNGNNWSLIEIPDSIYPNCMQVNNNQLYIGGPGAGNKYGGIVKWDGNKWTSFITTEQNIAVQAIAFKDKDVYIGGGFLEVDNVKANKIAHFNGNNWEKIGSGLDGNVSDIIIENDEIYVSGNFHKAGGKQSDYFAHYNPAKITNSRTASTFCEGADSAKLSVPNKFGKYQWKKDGRAIEGAVYDTLTVFNGSGKYTVELQYSGSTSKIVPPYFELNIIDKPEKPIITTPNNEYYFSKDKPIALSANSGSSSYKWNKAGNEVPAATGNTFTTTIQNLATFQVEVGNTTGCKNKSDIIKLYQLDTIAYPNKGFCGGANVDLNIPNDYTSIQWKYNGAVVSGANSDKLTATEEGTYSAIVTYSDNTTKETQSLALSKKDTPPKISISTGTTLTSFCPSDSLQLKAIEGYQYNWKGTDIESNATQNVYAKQAGFYSVDLINEAGCKTESFPIELTHKPAPPKPEINYIGKSNYFMFNNSVGDYRYQWYKDNQPLSGQIKPILETTLGGNYYLTLQNLGGGCMQKSETIAINKLKTVENFSVYPNPSQGSFTIEADNNQKPERIIVRDLYGRTIIDKKMISEEINFNIKVPQNIHGTLMLEIYCKGEKFFRQVLVE